MSDPAVTCPDKSPRRIQLSANKGWRKPDGAVVVAVPSKWANPWHLGPSTTRASVVQLYERWMRGDLVNHLERQRQKLVESLPELRDRDLACWCPLDLPCHADVLIHIANGRSEYL